MLTSCPIASGQEKTDTESFSREEVLSQLQHQQPFFRRWMAKQLLQHPQERVKYFPEIQELLKDSDPLVAITALDLSSRFLYFDDRSNQIEAGIASCLDHEDRSVAIKAMEVCVSYGIVPERVIQKSFQFMSDPDFRKTDVYRYSISFFHLAPDEPDRLRILDVARRELSSEDSARQEFAVEILTGFTPWNEAEWRLFFATSEATPAELSEKLLDRLYSRSLEITLPQELIEANPNYQQILARAAKLDPAGAAAFDLRRNPESQSAVKSAKAFLRDGNLRLLPVLEETGHLPAGSSYFIIEDLFQSDERLFDLWKKHHPDDAKLMETVISEVKQPEAEASQTTLGTTNYRAESLIFGYDALAYQYHYKPNLTVALSELPMVEEMLKSEDQRIRLAAVDLLGYMGTPVYKYSDPDWSRWEPDLRFSFERTQRTGAAYPEAVVSELEQLLSDTDSSVQIRALSKLVMTGFRKPEYIKLLEQVLQSSIENKQFSAACEEAIRLTGVLSPYSRDLADDVVQVILAQRENWKNETNWCGCFSCTTPRTKFQILCFDVSSRLPHEDDWLATLAAKLEEIPDRDSGLSSWNSMCRSLLRTVDLKSDKAAEILWKQYLKDREDEPQLDWVDKNLLAAINLADDPKPYLAELFRLAEAKWNEFELPDFTWGYESHLASLILLASEERHWDDLPFEKYGALFTRVARGESGYETLEGELNLYSLLGPYFEQHGEVCPYAESVILQQHQLVEPLGSYTSDLPEARHWLYKLIERGRIDGRPFKPLLKRMEKATLLDAWGRGDAALLRSVLEPDDPSHWKRIEQLYRYDQKSLSKYRERQKAALLAQKKRQTSP